MKTIKALKIMATVIIVAGLMLLIKGCKKNESNAGRKTAEEALAASMKAIKEKYGDVSTGQVIPINKDADEYFYRDNSGNKVSLYGTAAPSPNGTNGMGGCQYNCSNTTNPALLVITYTLNSVKRFYMCEAGSNPPKSTVTVNWTISAPFTVTAMMAGNIISTGYLKFTPSSGSPVILSTYYPDLTVTNIGPAPGCITNTLYQVEYKFTQVPNSYFLSGTTISAAADLANDCKLVGNMVSSGYVSAPSAYQNAYLPCNRLDAVSFNVAVGPPLPQNASVGGGYFGSCYPPSGMTGVDAHQFEYRKVTTTNGDYTWNAQTSAVYWGRDFFTLANTPTVLPTGIIDLNNMVWGTGKWLIRYRNVKAGTCDIIYGPGLTPNGNWGNSALWNTEMYDMY